MEACDKLGGLPRGHVIKINVGKGIEDLPLCRGHRGLGRRCRVGGCEVAHQAGLTFLASSGLAATSSLGALGLAFKELKQVTGPLDDGLR